MQAVAIVAAQRQPAQEAGAKLALRTGIVGRYFAVAKSDEYAFLKLRYKLPDSDTSTLITTPVTRSMEADGLSAAPREARFATAVAAFGQLLRGGRFTGTYGYDDVIKLAQGAKGDDPFGYRAEFINLVRLAKSAAALEPLKQ